MDPGSSPGWRRDRCHARLAPQPAAPAGESDLGGLSAATPPAAEGAVADRQISRGGGGGATADWGHSCSPFV